jgi:hypothetical protein
VSFIFPYRGKWHLLTGKQTDPVRIWVEKEAALSTLAEEGWEISEQKKKTWRG